MIFTYFGENHSWLILKCIEYPHYNNNEISPTMSLFNANLGYYVGFCQAKF